MKSKTSAISFACLLLISGQSKEQASSQNNNKVAINQPIKTTGNELKIITYLVGYGRVEGSLGTSVAGIGDINLDGFDDVIIGKPGKNAGEALILFGGIKMDSIPDIVLRGENEGDNFGGKVFSGGDINGDGASDFIVAAPNFPQRTAIGRIYIYFGGALLDTIPDFKIDGEQRYSSFGLYLTVGDVNQDQTDDILSSAPNFFSQSSRGKAYLYLGGTLLDGIPDWVNAGDSVRAGLGVNLSIGDINGDGKKDLLVNNASDINQLGNDYLLVTEIFLNKTFFDTTADFSIKDNSLGNFPNQILLSQDLNLDGIDDLIIRKSDQINIYLGKADLDTIPSAKLTPWYLAGINRVADAGDVNGDGYPDVFAGAWHVFFQSGSIGLYLGSPRINSEVDWVSSGGGYSIDGAGDVNGDGYDDLIVSNLSSQLTNVATGEAWIFAGRPDLKDIGSSVDFKPENTPPIDFKLFQNYPNPFKAATTFRFQQTQKFPKSVKLTIYDVTGKEVITLLEQQMPAGEYQINWNGMTQNGKEAARGLYFSRLSIGQKQQVIKLIRL